MSARLAPLIRIVIALILTLPIVVGGAPGGAYARGAGGNVAAPPPVGEVQPRQDDPTGPVSLMLELVEASAATTFADATAQGSSEADAGQRASAQKARNEQAQGRTVAALTGAVPAARVIYRVQTAYNGVAVRADAGKIGQLRGLPGVKAVHIIPLLTPDTSSSAPLIGAPQAWTSYGDTGQGMKIGIIDTGIDYTHANFGGPGTVAAFNTANSSSTTIPPGGLYPNARVVGGYDFAGDDYDPDGAGTGPQPDPNPLDCEGHGSHVAGIAAGNGVTDAGAAYTGPYNTNTPFNTMRIGPGVAPQAQLYALRVFGCTGSTDLATQAIEWAIDPNGDGNPADHLDVINMSLGSSYGTKADPTAVAADRAASLGVIVVTSAGNNGDITYISGSPGSAPRAIAVASSVDSSEVVDGFQVTAPAGIAGVKPATRSAQYGWDGSPPVTANLYYPATNQYGCSPWTGTDAANISGRIVLVDYRKVGDANSPCGSIARSTNARNAGAVGIIMADMTTPYFSTVITGTDTIRALLTTSPTGTQLKGQLTAGAISGVTVKISNEFANTGKLVNAGWNDTLSTFSSRGPRGGDGGLKPDIAAPGDTIFSAAVGTGNEGEVQSGTSMAAPHVAGVVALLRKQHPTWTVEEIKALAMNTAGQDLFTGENQTGTRYSPQRAGAGRVSVPAAMANTVLAYADGGGGEVSISFGALEVAGTLTQTRTIRVANKGGQAATYTLGYAARSTLAGVAYDFPDGTTVTVPAGGSATVRIRLTATASAMDNAHDPTLAETQFGADRQWLNEASGLVTLTPGGGNAAGAQTPLRVPVYAAARPASQMTTAQSQLVFPNGTGGATLNLTGQGVGDHLYDKTRHASLVTALELAATSGPLTLPAEAAHSVRAADLKSVGIGATRRDTTIPSRINNSTISFGIATHGNWSAPATEVTFDIYIDINRDGTGDYVLYNTRLDDGVDQSDVIVSALDKLGTGNKTLAYANNVSPQEMPTAIFDNNVLVLTVVVTGDTNGLDFGGSGNTRFNYQVVTRDRSTNSTVDESPVLTYDYANLGLDFATSPDDSRPTYLDVPGTTIPVTLNQAAYAANRSRGALLLHHYNTSETRDQIVPVPLTRTITFAPPASKTLGDPPFVVSATAAPSGTPTITSLTPAICTLGAGNTVTLLAAGNCTLRAAIADDGTYLAASTDATIVVAPGIAPSPSPSASPSPSPSASPSPSPGGTPITFADVPADYWAAPQIAQFAQRGITTGCDTDAQGVRYYCPERGVTRAEMATFLTRALGQDQTPPPATPTFADVPADYWAYGQIEAFVRLGITTGCGTNELGRRLYCPERGVTRAEMAAFLDRAKGQTELTPGTPTFADVPPDYWAYGWIERFLALNITTGCGTDDQGRRVYCPDRGVTRAEMAVFIIRAYP
jgi:subtilisin family serine protease